MLPSRAATPPTDGKRPRWLLLIHQIPPTPPYFRAKVGRRLARVGAVAIKNSVYVVPLSDATREDFQWVTREIVAEGGDATLCTADFIDGLRDDRVEALFHEARDADYAETAKDARDVARALPRKIDDALRAESLAHVTRLRKRMGEIVAIDFFAASGRVSAESAIADLERRVRTKEPPRAKSSEHPNVRGAVWVTRKNVHVDRIASAWLVRRFIDPKARFKFVPGQGYRAAKGEVTFDMYEGTFTHECDLCTFETLMHRFALREPGLQAIAEIIHDVDVKDGKFARPEAPGVAALVAGIALSCPEDEARIELGGRMLDAMLALYKRRRP